MSFRAIAEFILHIEHFRNVDLFQQGVYYLKFQLFNEDIEKVFNFTLLSLSDLLC
jgi:hypothetical protein